MMRIQIEEFRFARYLIYIFNLNNRSSYLGICISYKFHEGCSTFLQYIMNAVAYITTKESNRYGWLPLVITLEYLLSLHL